MNLSVVTLELSSYAINFPYYSFRYKVRHCTGELFHNFQNKMSPFGTALQIYYNLHKY